MPRQGLVRAIQRSARSISACGLSVLHALPDWLTVKSRIADETSDVCLCHPQARSARRAVLVRLRGRTPHVHLGECAGGACRAAGRGPQHGLRGARPPGGRRARRVPRGALHRSRLAPQRSDLRGPARVLQPFRQSAAVARGGARRVRRDAARSVARVVYRRAGHRARGLRQRLDSDDGRCGRAAARGSGRSGSRLHDPAAEPGAVRKPELDHQRPGRHAQLSACDQLADCRGPHARAGRRERRRAGGAHRSDRLQAVVRLV